MSGSRTSQPRFQDDPNGVGSSILTGVQQSVDPRYDKAFIKRNLAPYAPYGLPTNPDAFKGQTDQQLRDLAVKTVLKEYRATNPGSTPPPTNPSGPPPTRHPPTRTPRPRGTRPPTPPTRPTRPPKPRTPKPPSVKPPFRRGHGKGKPPVTTPPPVTPPPTRRYL